MTVEAKGRVVRVTTGLNPHLYRQTSLSGLLDKEACYEELLRQLHPAGLVCECGVAERINYGQTKHVSNH